MILVKCLLKLMTKGSAGSFLLVITIIQCLPLSELQHPRLTASKAAHPESKLSRRFTLNLGFNVNQCSMGSCFRKSTFVFT